MPIHIWPCESVGWWPHMFGIATMQLCTGVYMFYGFQVNQHQSRHTCTALYHSLSFRNGEFPHRNSHRPCQQKYHDYPNERNENFPTHAAKQHYARTRKKKLLALICGDKFSGECVFVCIELLSSSETWFKQISRTKASFISAGSWA